MEIKKHDDGKRGNFRALEHGVEAGLMTFTWAGTDKFIIDHTEVSPNFAGRGVGRELLMAAVGFAREHNLKIMPLCPFAKSVFDKTSEIKDVLF